MQRQATRNEGASLVCQKPECMVSSSLILVENAVVEGLKPILEQIIIQEEDSEQNDENYRLIEMIKVQQKTAAFQIDKLHDLLEQGVYDIETYRARFAALKSKIKKLDQAMQSANIFHINYDIISKSYIDILSAYNSFNASEKNQLLKSILNKVVYQKQKGAKPAEFTVELNLKNM
jgi:hypothetical protein